MDLAHLRYFYEIARHGSFTAAARAIRVSQPSLSKMIRQLEEREGMTLFVRGKRGVALTEEGKLVFRSCQTVFGELDSLKTTLNEKSETVAGELSIGASDNVCNYLLPPFLGTLRSRYPQLTLKVFSGAAAQIQSELLEGRAELGVFYTKVKGREFVSDPLRFVEFALVYAKRAAKKGRSIDLDALPYIGSRFTDYARSYPALDMLHSIGIQPKLAFETNNQEMQKRLALEGVGYTLVPIHMVHAELKSGALLRARSPKPLGAWLSLVRRPNRPLSRGARLFADELMRELGRPK